MLPFICTASCFLSSIRLAPVYGRQLAAHIFKLLNQFMVMQYPCIKPQSSPACSSWYWASWNRYLSTMLLCYVLESSCKKYCYTVWNGLFLLKCFTVLNFVFQVQDTRCLQARAKQSHRKQILCHYLMQHLILHSSLWYLQCWLLPRRKWWPTHDQMALRLSVLDQIYQDLYWSCSCIKKQTSDDTSPLGTTYQISGNIRILQVLWRSQGSRHCQIGQEHIPGAGHSA